MRPFAAAWRGYLVGQVAAGDREPWDALYRAACRVERSAAWLKVYFWRRSIRRPPHDQNKETDRGR